MFSVVVDLDTNLHLVMQPLSSVNCWKYIVQSTEPREIQILILLMIFIHSFVIFMENLHACACHSDLRYSSQQVEREIIFVYGGGSVGLMGFISPDSI